MMFFWGVEAGTILMSRLVLGDKRTAELAMKYYSITQMAAAMERHPHAGRSLQEAYFDV